jgi:hypothetical protein
MFKDIGKSESFDFVSATPCAEIEEPIYYTRQEVVGFLLTKPDKLFKEVYNEFGEYVGDKDLIIGMQNNSEIIYKANFYPTFKLVVNDDKAKYILLSTKFQEFTLAKVIELFNERRLNIETAYSVIDCKETIEKDCEYGDFFDINSSLPILEGKWIIKNYMTENL